MNRIDFENNTLKIDRKIFELDFNIKDARIVNDLAIVIYAFDKTAPTNSQFRNCNAFDLNGNLIWTAEHPTSANADSYVEFIKGKENRLWNFGGFVCELDFQTGKLLNARFTK